jgi:hypothetical protein|tara:strand:+ start:1157 stop:1558 length:402 start_codon:yes stop_codon:yes gene_type:complete
MGVAFYFNFFHELYEKDITKISFVIISIYLVTSLFIGRLAFKLKNGESIESGLGVGWFISESMLALGMIGTVAGFILMLGSSFEGLDVENIESLKQTLTDMAIGMSTALYTTLTGLIFSQFTKVQLVNLESND